MKKGIKSIVSKLNEIIRNICYIGYDEDSDEKIMTILKVNKNIDNALSILRSETHTHMEIRNGTNYIFSDIKYESIDKVLENDIIVTVSFPIVSGGKNILYISSNKNDSIFFIETKNENDCADHIEICIMFKNQYVQNDRIYTRFYFKDLDEYINDTSMGSSYTSMLIPMPVLDMLFNSRSKIYKYIPFIYSIYEVWDTVVRLSTMHFINTENPLYNLYSFLMDELESNDDSIYDIIVDMDEDNDSTMLKNIKDYIDTYKKKNGITETGNFKNSMAPANLTVKLFISDHDSKYISEYADDSVREYLSKFIPKYESFVKKSIDNIIEYIIENNHIDPEKGFANISIGYGKFNIGSYGMICLIDQTECETKKILLDKNTFTDIEDDLDILAEIIISVEEGSLKSTSINQIKQNAKGFKDIIRSIDNKVEQNTENVLYIDPNGDISNELDNTVIKNIELDQQIIDTLANGICNKVAINSIKSSFASFYRSYFDWLNKPQYSRMVCKSENPIKRSDLDRDDIIINISFKSVDVNILFQKNKSEYIPSIHSSSFIDTTNESKTNPIITVGSCYGYYSLKYFMDTDSYLDISNNFSKYDLIDHLLHLLKFSLSLVNDKINEDFKLESFAEDGVPEIDDNQLLKNSKRFIRITNPSFENMIKVFDGHELYKYITESGFDIIINLLQNIVNNNDIREISAKDANKDFNHVLSETCVIAFNNYKYISSPDDMARFKSDNCVKFSKDVIRFYDIGDNHPITVEFMKNDYTKSDKFLQDLIHVIKYCKVLKKV